jgi:hypothetical protein
VVVRQWTEIVGGSEGGGYHDARNNPKPQFKNRVGRTPHNVAGGLIQRRSC